MIVIVYLLQLEVGTQVPSVQFAHHGVILEIPPSLGSLDGGTSRSYVGILLNPNWHEL